MNRSKTLSVFLLLAACTFVYAGCEDATLTELELEPDLALASTGSTCQCALAIRTGDWHDAETWSDGLVPDDDDDVEIGNEWTVTISGTVNLTGALILRHNGKLITTSSAVLNNRGLIRTQGSFGAITNNGTLNNTGEIDLRTGHRALHNLGAINNQAATIHVRSADGGGIFTPPPSLINDGKITNDAGSTITVLGELVNNGAATITNSGIVLTSGVVMIEVSGKIVNHGTIDNVAGTIEVSESTLTNEGAITNHCGAGMSTPVGGRHLLEWGGDIIFHCKTAISSGDWFSDFTWSDAEIPTGTEDLIIPSIVGVSISGEPVTYSGTLTIHGGIEISSAGNVEFPFTNEGTIDIHGGIGVRHEGALDNGGLINNHGTMVIMRSMRNRSEIDNHGSIDNFGILENAAGFSGTIINRPGAEITNRQAGMIRNLHGTVDNHGSITNLLGDAKIVNAADATFNNRRDAILTNSGEVQNAGVFSNDGRFLNVTAFSAPSGLVVNTGVFNTSWIFDNLGFIRNDGGTFTNSSSLSNFVSLTNNASLINTDDLFNSGTLTNSGTFTNKVSMRNANTGVLTNAGGTSRNDGIIANAGTISHTDDGVTNNNGTINNECGGSVTGTVTGNEPVNLCDTTPPVITPTVTGTLGSNGWYVSNVGVSWDVTDPESAIGSTSGCEAASVTADTDGATFTCTATSVGGTDSMRVTIKRDATPPSVAAAATAAPNDFGWYNTSVTVEASGEDETSGIDQCDAVTLDGEDADQEATVGCRDRAGNTASATVTGINIDRTPPVVTGTPSRDADHGGWYNHALSVDWSGTDELSGIDACSSPTGYDGPDGAGVSVTGECTDMAGNIGTRGVTFQYDATPPTITFSGNQGSYLTDEFVRIACAASDATSGIDAGNTTCPDTDAPAYSFALGANTISAAAMDLAGNEAAASTTFTVEVTHASLSNLVDRFVGNRGVATSLKQQLAAMEAARTVGAREGVRRAFTQLVEAQRGRALTGDQADTLIRLVQGL